MVTLLLKSLWMALPVVLGGLTHVLVIKADWLAPLARVPLDARRTFRGKRLLGKNKTVRGLVVMTAATAGWAVALEALRQRAGWSPALLLGEPPPPPALFGALLGLGYVAGELPNSFLKRQLDISPGAPAPGARRPLFWLVDQVDSLAGVLLFAGLAVALPLGVVACLLAITLFLHPAVAALMVALRLKDRIG